MNRMYIEKVQELITEKLQDVSAKLTTEQIKDLLRISAELEIMKKEIPF